MLSIIAVASQVVVVPEVTEGADGQGQELTNFSPDPYCYYPLT
jgi:hypothetical protein